MLARWADKSYARVFTHDTIGLRGISALYFLVNCKFLAVVCVVVSSCCRRPLRDICFVSRLAVSSFLDNFLVRGSVGSFFNLWYGPLSFREDILVWYVSVTETTSASPLSAGSTLMDCSSFRRRSM